MTAITFSCNRYTSTRLYQQRPFRTFRDSRCKYDAASTFEYLKSISKNSFSRLNPSTSACRSPPALTPAPPPPPPVPPCAFPEVWMLIGAVWEEMYVPVGPIGMMFPAPPMVDVSLSSKNSEVRRCVGARWYLPVTDPPEELSVSVGLASRCAVLFSVCRPGGERGEVGARREVLLARGRILPSHRAWVWAIVSVGGRRCVRSGVSWSSWAALESRMEGLNRNPARAVYKSY